MSNCIRQLILITKAKLDCFITLFVIFSINAIFVQITFAQSLDSSQDIEVAEVILVDELQVVDELQAESFINQLSNYDHIDAIELSDSEAQALLDQVNSQVLSYSHDKTLESLLSFCSLGASIGLISGAFYPIVYYGFGKIKGALQFTGIIFAAVPLGTAGGCLIGTATGGVMYVLDALAEKILGAYGINLNSKNLN